MKIIIIAKAPYIEKPPNILTQTAKNALKKYQIMAQITPPGSWLKKVSFLFGSAVNKNVNKITKNIKTKIDLKSGLMPTT